MQTKQDNDMTHRTSVIYTKNNNELSWSIESGVVYNQNQTGQQRDWWYECNLQRKWNSIVVIDQTGYSLWWKLNRTTTRLMHRFSLCWNWNWTIMTYLTGCGLWWKPDRTITWLITQVWSMPKTIMNYHDRWDRVQSMTKTREENNVIDCISAIYAENDTKLSWLIGLGVEGYENKIC